MRQNAIRATSALVVIAFMLAGSHVAASGASKLVEGELLHTGMRITPTAAPGSVFQTLNPDLPGLPDFVAGQAVSTALSPDGRTLLVLTSGYNRMNGPTGSRRGGLVERVRLRLRRERDRRP